MSAIVVRLGSSLFFHEDIRGIMIPSNPKASKKEKKEEELKIKITFRNGDNLCMVYDTTEERDRVFKVVCEALNVGDKDPLS